MQERNKGRPPADPGRLHGLLVCLDGARRIVIVKQQEAILVPASCIGSALKTEGQVGGIEALGSGGP